MRTTKWLAALILASSCFALPIPSRAGVFVGVSVNIAPPPLPIYAQPILPGPGYFWMPGYWAWGPYGYYWVPGTWVLSPRPGLLWTPGWWGWNGYAYYWHRGYWAPHVGFYGGINYGFGYFGVGYVGGGWFGNVFRYNTAVTNVNTTIVRNVYVDKTVIVNRNVYVNDNATRVSYNGGAGGVKARPTEAELAAAHEAHVPMTGAQMRHVRIAAHDRTMLASFNHGRPAQRAVARPFSMRNRPAAFERIAPRERASARAAARAHVVGGQDGRHVRRHSRPMQTPRPAAYGGSKEVLGPARRRALRTKSTINEPKAKLADAATKRIR